MPCHMMRQQIQTCIMHLSYRGLTKRKTAFRRRRRSSERGPIEVMRKHSRRGQRERHVIYAPHPEIEKAKLQYKCTRRRASRRKRVGGSPAARAERAYSLYCVRCGPGRHRPGLALRITRSISSLAPAISRKKRRRRWQERRWVNMQKGVADASVRSWASRGRLQRRTHVCM